MERQYFTYRNFQLPNGSITPDHTLANNFNGLKFTYELDIASNRNKDGRFLGLIESENKEEMEAILEGLKVFSIHLKTPVKAKNFVNSILEIESVVKDGLVVFPKNKDE
jgi:hypothetical protein